MTASAPVPSLPDEPAVVVLVLLGLCGLVLGEAFRQVPLRPPRVTTLAAEERPRRLSCSPA